MLAEIQPIDNRNKNEIVIIDKAYDPVVLYLKSLNSLASQKNMAKVLFIFARWYLEDKKATPQQIAWKEIDYLTMVNYQRYLQDIKKLAPSTINNYFNAVKGVLKKSRRIKRVSPENKISADDYDEIFEIKLVRGSRTSRGKALTDEQINTIIDGIDEKPIAGIRDKAIFSVFVYVGPRLNELCGLRYPDAFEKNGKLSFIGKGNKEREVPINKKTKDVLDKWINDVRGKLPGPLFSRIWKTGDIGEKPLSESGVRDILVRCAMSVPDLKISPHDLRRTFGTRLLSKNVDLFTVQDMLGHESPETTKRYDKRGDEDKISAVELL